MSEKRSEIRQKHSPEAETRMREEVLDAAPYIAANLSLLDHLPIGEHIFTEADRARLDQLSVILKAKERFEPPPPEEAHLYMQGVHDVESPSGSIIGRRPCWYPKAESDEFSRLRLKESDWRDA